MAHYNRVGKAALRLGWHADDQPLRYGSDIFETNALDRIATPPVRTTA
jgi:hypothetical protein